MVHISYRIQKGIVLWVLCAYFVIGMSTEWVTHRSDRYPVFSWSLFSKIPNVQTDFTIEIYSIGDMHYDPPLPFLQTKFLFDAIGQSPTDYTRTIYELGNFIVRGDKEGARARADYLEKVFNGQPYEYSVLKVVYDPIDYWRSGAYRDKIFLARFSSL